LIAALRLGEAEHVTDADSLKAADRRLQAAQLVRYTRTWIKTAAGWRLLAAHVSPAA